MDIIHDEHINQVCNQSPVSRTGISAHDNQVCNSSAPRVDTNPSLEVLRTCKLSVEAPSFENQTINKHFAWHFCEYMLLCARLTSTKSIYCHPYIDYCMHHSSLCFNIK